MPIDQAHRGSLRQDHSPGLTGPSGDFTWYYLFRNIFLSYSKTRVAAHVDPPYGDYFTTRFCFIADNALAQRIAVASNPMEVNPTIVPIHQADAAQHSAYVGMQEASSVTPFDYLCIIRSSLVMSDISVAGVETVADAEVKMGSLSTVVPQPVTVEELVVPSVKDDSPDIPNFCTPVTD